MIPVGPSQTGKLRSLLERNVVGRNEMKTPEFQLVRTVQLEHTANTYDLSIVIRPIKDNLNAIGHAVGQDSETKSTEHCPKYKQSTVI